MYSRWINCDNDYAKTLLVALLRDGGLMLTRKRPPEKAARAPGDSFRLLLPRGVFYIPVVSYCM